MISDEHQTEFLFTIETINDPSESPPSIPGNMQESICLTVENKDDEI